MTRLFFFYIWFSFISYGQLQDSTCIDARWISLRNTPENATIFGTDSSPDSLSLYHTIKELVKKEQKIINTSGSNTIDRSFWYPIYINKRMYDSIETEWFLKNYGGTFDTIVEYSDRPLINIYGEDSIVKIDTDKNSDSKFELVYPRLVYVFPYKICDEIRIKESRVVDKITGKTYFKPVGLSFYYGESEHFEGYEVFWVDLELLFKHLPNKEEYSWCRSLEKKEYKGFQYLQQSCYERIIRN